MAGCVFQRWLDRNRSNIGAGFTNAARDDLIHEMMGVLKQVLLRTQTVPFPGTLVIDDVAAPHPPQLPQPKRRRGRPAKIKQEVAHG